MSDTLREAAELLLTAHNVLRRHPIPEMFWDNLREALGVREPKPYIAGVDEVPKDTMP
jgi:hypothetical protein